VGEPRPDLREPRPEPQQEESNGNQGGNQQ
jgi:hypothetical protein